MLSEPTTTTGNSSPLAWWMVITCTWPFGKGLVWVLVLVDAAVVEQAQEAVEEVKPEELAVLVRDDGVVVVALEDVQELREERQVAGGVRVAHRALERVEREQVVEVVGRAQVERFAFLQGGDLAGPPLQAYG